MMKLIDTTHHLYTKERAEQVAMEMSTMDDEWKFVPVHDPNGTGFSFVEIFDEAGEYVGRV